MLWNASPRPPFPCLASGTVPTKVRSFSYVDNWDLTTSHPDFAINQLQLVLDFADLVDLTIDRKKTYGWSTSPEIRGCFRRHDIPVKGAARDLGAHIAYNKQYTNSTVKDRLDSLEDFWTALRRSSAPYHVKLLAVRTVAWPRGLHAVSSTPIGATVWKQLRSTAVQALLGRKAGVNSHLLLSLVEGTVDPEEIALVASIRDAREFAPEGLMQTTVAPLANGELDLPPNAPSCILLYRLHQVGISVSSEGRLVDRFGTFDLHDSFQEVRLRLQWAAHQKAAAAVAHRPDFQGLDWANVCATRLKLQSLSATHQALYRLNLAGGSFTADFTAHWSDSGSACCKWCGQQDSLRHRFWECPQTQPLRARLAPKASSCVDSLPPALTLRGWAIYPPSWPQWISYLADLPRAIPQPFCAFPPLDWVDVFTDGSCHHQSHPSLRLAAWSAVIAMPFGATWRFGVHGLLGASFLPGVIQTAFRAELYALGFVLHWAAAYRMPVRVWTDCLGVVNRFLLLLQGKRHVRPNTSNADLWSWVMQSVHELGSTKIKVYKVAAHQQIQSATTLRQAWLIWNNGAADRAAKMANNSRPSQCWTLWTQLVNEYFDTQELYNEVVSLHLAVADLSVTSSTADDIDQVPERIRKPNRTFQKIYEADGWDGNPPIQVSQRYTQSLARKLAHWWTARVTGSRGSEQWVPLVYIYVDYQLTFGCPGPIKIQRSWVEHCQRPYLIAEKYKHQQRLRWFLSFLACFFKAANITVGMATCRPDTEVVQAFIPTLSVGWDPWCIAKIEAWLRSHLVKPCTRAAKELKCLPLACSDAAMALLPAPTRGD